MFVRSYVAPAQLARTYKTRRRWQLLKNDLGDLELLGENPYTIHSIEYRTLEQDFYLFAVRCQDMWLSWEEVQLYVALFDSPYTPEISGPQPGDDEKSWQRDFLMLIGIRNTFDPWDMQICQPCTLEGIVSRSHDVPFAADFSHSVFKYVCRNHIGTTVHWKRHRQRARITHEFVYGEQS